MENKEPLPCDTFVYEIYVSEPRFVHVPKVENAINLCNVPYPIRVAWMPFYKAYLPQLTEFIKKYVDIKNIYNICFDLTVHEEHYCGRPYYIEFSQRLKYLRATYGAIIETKDCYQNKFFKIRHGGYSYAKIIINKKDFIWTRWKSNLPEYECIDPEDEVDLKPVDITVEICTEIPDEIAMEFHGVPACEVDCNKWISCLMDINDPLPYDTFVYREHSSHKDKSLITTIKLNNSIEIRDIPYPTKITWMPFYKAYLPQLTELIERQVHINERKHINFKLMAHDKYYCGKPYYILHRCRRNRETNIITAYATTVETSAVYHRKFYKIRYGGYSYAKIFMGIDIYYNDYIWTRWKSNLPEYEYIDPEDEIDLKPEDITVEICTEIPDEIAMKFHNGPACEVDCNKWISSIKEINNPLPYDTFVYAKPSSSGRIEFDFMYDGLKVKNSITIFDTPSPTKTAWMPFYKAYLPQVTKLIKKYSHIKKLGNYGFSIMTIDEHYHGYPYYILVDYYDWKEMTVKYYTNTEIKNQYHRKFYKIRHGGYSYAKIFTKKIGFIWTRWKSNLPEYEYIDPEDEVDLKPEDITVEICTEIPDEIAMEFHGVPACEVDCNKWISNLNDIALHPQPQPIKIKYKKTPDKIPYEIYPSNDYPDMLLTVYLSGKVDSLCKKQVEKALDDFRYKYFKTHFDDISYITLLDEPDIPDNAVKFHIDFGNCDPKILKSIIRWMGKCELPIEKIVIE